METITSDSSEINMKIKLSDFINNNPESLTRIIEDNCLLINPWGDQSVEFRVHTTDEELITTLNTLYFPPKFSAIWHRDSKDLEIIWTPHRVEKDIPDRSFEFQFNGNNYHCQFSQSSDRLLTIASAFKSGVDRGI